MNNTNRSNRSSDTRKRKLSFGMNIGSSSLLLVFVILCLISFAALSIVSANADHKLTTKILTRTSDYYAACNEVEQSLANLDTVLISQYKSSASRDSYFATVGHTKSFTVAVTDTQSLFVEVEILYPERADDTYYKIVSWNIINN